MAIRLPVMLAGLLLGWLVYAYGMFHTILPTWSDISDVANCGDSPAARRLAEFGRPPVPDPDANLCKVSSGEWKPTPYGDGPFFAGMFIILGFTLTALYRTRLGYWAAHCLKGNLMTGLTVFGLTMTLLGIHLNFTEGTLTGNWALHCAFYGELGGAVFGLLMWYTVTRLLLQKKAGKLPRLP
jgi:hypothetical protein